MRQLLPSILGLAAAWYLADLAIDSSAFPGPIETISKLASIVLASDFYLSVFATLGLSVIGASLGLVAAYVVGVLMAKSSFLYRSIRPSLNAIRSVPTIILLPLFLVVAGPSPIAVVALTTHVIFGKLIVFVVDGLRNTNPNFDELGELLGLSRVAKFFLIELPQSFKLTITGIQLSASRAYGTVILGGLFIGTPGLGRSLAWARETADYGAMFSYGLLLALLGVLIYELLLNLENRVLTVWGIIR